MKKIKSWKLLTCIFCRQVASMAVAAIWTYDDGAIYMRCYCQKCDKLQAIKINGDSMEQLKFDMDLIKATGQYDAKQ